MGAWLSVVVSECLWREAALVEQPSLVEHYYKIQKEMCDIESLLEQRAKATRCC